MRMPYWISLFRIFSRSLQRICCFYCRTSFPVLFSTIAKESRAVIMNDTIKNMIPMLVSAANSSISSKLSPTNMRRYPITKITTFVCVRIKTIAHMKQSSVSKINATFQLSNGESLSSALSNVPIQKATKDKKKNVSNNMFFQLRLAAKETRLKTAERSTQETILTS